MNLLLVPLICLEENSLQRIGYGGGYYDNYIKENKPKNTISIGIAL
jgi:5-formyltetrahydrofolate cyclo-ligase